MSFRRSFSRKICEEDLTMPITAGDFRKGVIFEMEGKPMLVVDFQHVKPGKGAAFVRTKYKNVMTGAIPFSSMLRSSFAPNSTGAAAFPLTIGRIYA